MKKLINILLAVLIILMAAGCSSDSNSEKTLDSEVMKKGVLIVGTSPDYPPFESLDTSGNIVGADIDMINELVKYIKTAEGEQYTVEFVAMDFSTIISALQTGQVDVGISAFSYNPDRKCLFSDPYYDSAQVVAVGKNSGISSLADLNGKLVAAGTGTVGWDAASAIEGVKMTAAGDYQQQFELLRVNQIDAVVCDETVALGYVRSSDDFRILSEYLTEDKLCITVAEGNQNILAAINNAISQYNATSMPDQIREKWGI